MLIRVLNLTFTHKQNDNIIRKVLTAIAVLTLQTFTGVFKVIFRHGIRALLNNFRSGSTGSDSIDSTRWHCMMNRRWRHYTKFPPILFAEASYTGSRLQQVKRCNRNKLLKVGKSHVTEYVETEQWPIQGRRHLRTKFS